MTVAFPVKNLKGEAEPNVIVGTWNVLLSFEEVGKIMKTKKEIPRRVARAHRLQSASILSKSKLYHWNESSFNQPKEWYKKNV